VTVDWGMEGFYMGREGKDVLLRGERLHSGGPHLPQGEDHVTRVRFAC